MMDSKSMSCFGLFFFYRSPDFEMTSSYLLLSTLIQLKVYVGIFLASSRNIFCTVRNLIILLQFLRQLSTDLNAVSHTPKLDQDHRS